MTSSLLECNTVFFIKYRNPWPLHGYKQAQFIYHIEFSARNFYSSNNQFILLLKCILIPVSKLFVQRLQKTQIKATSALRLSLSQMC